MSDMTIQNAIHCMKAMICEAVCEECDYYGKTGTDHCEEDAVRMAIKALEEQPHWIACSERMPSDEDYDETFTVTIQCEHYDGWDDYVTGYADWTPHGWDIQSYYLGQIKVVAWMPLPKPYGGESE